MKTFFLLPLISILSCNHVVEPTEQNLTHIIEEIQNGKSIEAKSDGNTFRIDENMNPTIRIETTRECTLYRL